MDTPSGETHKKTQTVRWQVPTGPRRRGGPFENWWGNLSKVKFSVHHSVNRLLRDSSK